MAAEDFFSRWAKVKSVPAAASAQVVDGAVSGSDAAALPPQPSVPPPPPPTMLDVANLTGDSDFSPFMAKGVDQAVRRGAMKKLFADPHYNIMDGLDIYIGDYNTFVPIPPEMLALLDHAKGVLDPRSMFEKPVMQMISVPKPVPVVELEPELEAEAELESELEPDAGAELEVESGRETAPEIAPASDAISDATSEPESDATSEPESAEVEPAIEPESASASACEQDASLPTLPSAAEAAPLHAAGVAAPVPQSRTW